MLSFEMRMLRVRAAFHAAQSHKNSFKNIVFERVFMMKKAGENFSDKPIP